MMMIMAMTSTTLITAATVTVELVVVATVSKMYNNTFKMFPCCLQNYDIYNLMQAASPDGLVESDVEDDTYVATDDVGKENDVDEMSFDDSNVVFVVFD